MNNDYKKLLRTRDDKMVCGVCGGIGKYFNIDPTLVRILWVIFSIASFGTGLIAYIVGAVIIPEEI